MKIKKYNVLAVPQKRIAENGYGFKQWGLSAQMFNRSDKKNKEKFLVKHF